MTFQPTNLSRTATTAAITTTITIASVASTTKAEGIEEKI